MAQYDTTKQGLQIYCQYFLWLISIMCTFILEQVVSLSFGNMTDPRDGCLRDPVDYITVIAHRYMEHY